MTRMVGIGSIERGIDNYDYDKAGAKWVKDHPDYKPCQKNFDLLRKYLERAKTKPTYEALTMAFEGLKAIGVLEMPECKAAKEKR